MTTGDELTGWQSWVRQPQALWWRRVLFQVHLWSGLGLYVFFISVTGSVLVYRNELYVAATPEPIVSTGSGPRLTDDELGEAARRAHQGFRVERLVRAIDPDEAVDSAASTASGFRARDRDSAIRRPRRSGRSLDWRLR